MRKVRSVMEGGELPIVLTATISPAVQLGVPLSPEIRRLEYVNALRFYRRFSRVYFLENSGHPLANDTGFTEITGVELRQMPPSPQPERGKGYQEFEMLDNWISREENMPPRWLKITGRYVVQNVEAILNESRERADCAMLIDLLRRTRLARTHIFCVNTGYYFKRVKGLYAQSDDSSGEWVEKVLYRRLRSDSVGASCCFATQPRISAITGAHGHPMRPDVLPYLLKQSLRSINRLLDKRELWYPTY